MPEPIKIDHLANLARLALTPEEKAEFNSQLGDIVSYMEQLNKVDISNVEPTAHGFPIYNVWQADESRPGLPVDLALKNAPAQRQNMIVVPKVVE